MPRKRPAKPTTDEIMTNLTMRFSSIGQLERLAGVEQSHDARWQFWRPFCKLPASESLDAGVAELRARIRQKIECGKLTETSTF